ncbi:MAG TPA: PLDc N-terminal domain-containing protein [Planctomycetaceae bacterium]|nr:PLDc N-terminal domain-containing protein [Planctomycetaceae bacterium]
MLELLAYQSRDATGAVMLTLVAFSIAGLSVVIWALRQPIKNPNILDAQSICCVTILFLGGIGPLLCLFGNAPADAHILSWAALVIAGLVLLIWALLHAIQNPHISDAQRICWVIISLLLAGIGPPLYLLVGRLMGPPRSDGDPEL